MVTVVHHEYIKYTLSIYLYKEPLMLIVLHEYIRYTLSIYIYIYIKASLSTMNILAIL